MKYKAIPVQYADLPDIDEAAPLTDSDRTLFLELQQVLARYNALDRFGITLLHNHFPIEEGEVLVESCDMANRVLTIRPKKAGTSTNTIETNWRFMEMPRMLDPAEAQAIRGGGWKSLLTCVTECPGTNTGGHAQVHSSGE